MALDQFGVEVFLALKQREVPLQRILTLGRQHLAVSSQNLDPIPGLLKFEKRTGKSIDFEGTFADSFFNELGISEVKSLDASDYESCSLVHDLNEPVPKTLHGDYDLVFDGGTLEHVFHFPNAITNAMNLVKPGGLLVMQSPSNNFNGHGFYQFSPELLFRTFSKANGFRIRCMALIETGRKTRRYQVKDPDSLGKRNTFGGNGPLQMILVAQRERSEPISLKTPYQSDYSAAWNKGVSTEHGATQSRSKTGLKQLIRNCLPGSLLQHYDYARVATRQRQSSQEGVVEVKALEDCFHPDEDWLHFAETA